MVVANTLPNEPPQRSRLEKLAMPKARLVVEQQMQSILSPKSGSLDQPKHQFLNHNKSNKRQNNDE